MASSAAEPAPPPPPPPGSASTRSGSTPVLFEIPSGVPPIPVSRGEDWKSEGSNAWIPSGMDPALAFRLVVRLNSSFTRDSKHWARHHLVLGHHQVVGHHVSLLLLPNSAVALLVGPQQHHLSPVLVVARSFAMEDQYMEDIAFGARFDDTDDEEKNENDDSLILADYEGEDLPTIEWNRENPQLAKGTVFQTMMDCRNAITTYHILTKNNYEIKKNKEIHRCPPLGGEPELKTKLAKTRWLADIILDWLRENPSLGPTALVKKVVEKYKMEVPYMRMFYAKEMALDKINGPWNESFRLLYTFKAEVEMASPGSVVAIDKFPTN
ncbi:hypothetical protein QYE76_068588 [Lolium multiflorum]|uniref:Uncharacterized protein n=1 Tax=Lolium multiflorum TaxID=4521 RepID=A0AAD8SFS5_LOLMU|nr:hypothetical protein QYE76_068588 [Lolium multiflorum]